MTRFAVLIQSSSSANEGGRKFHQPSAQRVQMIAIQCSPSPPLLVIKMSAPSNDTPKTWALIVINAALLAWKKKTYFRGNKKSAVNQFRNEFNSDCPYIEISRQMHCGFVLFHVSHLPTGCRMLCIVWTSGLPGWLGVNPHGWRTEGLGQQQLS